MLDTLQTKAPAAGNGEGSQEITTSNCSLQHAQKIGNKSSLIDALQPIVQRVRTDVSAVKKDGKQLWTREPITEARLAKHLNGGPARGVCPIKAGESVTMVALLDLDSHKGETPWPAMVDTASEVMEELERRGMRPIPFRSSGGKGIHLYLLWDEPQDAYSVRGFLDDVLVGLAYRNGAGGIGKGEIEVFPKQDSVAPDGFGNQFILPLAGESVPLEPLLGLDPMDKDFALRMSWPSSPAVPVLVKPSRELVAVEASGDLSRLRSALAAIPNEGDKEQDYDKWRNIVFGIHHASSGSEEGRALAHEFSARSSKYDGDFLDNRVWPYARDRDNGITERTILALAREHGWIEDVSGDFEDVTDPVQSSEDPPHYAFYAYLPAHQYLHRPTRAYWPAASVDGHIPIKIGKLKISQWLDKHRAVQQATWHPAHGELLKDMVVADGGFVPKPGAVVYNRYRPPVIKPSAADVLPWLNHLRAIYPNEAEHLVLWFAHRVQRPGEKINHALVLGGSQGIGKDTILEPVRRSIGPWNWADIDPKKLTNQFNPFVESVVLRINEARDLGDLDRFAFYDHSKTYIAAPPDVLMCNDKHAKEYPVFNVMGVIVTTNHKTNGIYLPMDDRRHFVAWSDAHKEDFSQQYWLDLWAWIDAGGDAAVAGYLHSLDLSGFNPKAPPPKTDAFFAIVQANANPDDVALASLTMLEDGGKLPVVTLDQLAAAALNADDNELFNVIRDPKNRRRVPHMMERAGYIPVRNPDAPADGLWKIGGKRQVVYGDVALSFAERVEKTRLLIGAGR